MNAQNLIALLSIFFFFGICIIVFFVTRGIWRTFKRFIFELIDHIKGTPKQGKNNTPPWEE